MGIKASMLGFCCGWLGAANVKYRESLAFIKERQGAGETIDRVYFVGDDGQGDIHTAYEWFLNAKALNVKFTAYIRQVRRKRNFDSKEGTYEKPNKDFQR